MTSVCKYRMLRPTVSTVERRGEARRAPTPGEVPALLPVLLLRRMIESPAALAIYTSEE